MDKAWDIYYGASPVNLFRNIDISLFRFSEKSKSNFLNLQLWIYNVSASLLKARNLELAVPWKIVRSLVCLIRLRTGMLTTMEPKMKRIFKYR